MLGACMMDARNGAPSLPVQSEIAAIAGLLNLGVGWLLGVGNPSDGVVKVAEAVHVDLRDRQIVQLSHSGLLLSRRVADLVRAFLCHGSFSAVCRARASVPQ